ncbi:hypothetical protein SEA_PSONYX_25 [Corynebacterium phage PSonyx]|nr:hypothetical protein SEA_PSONYX_25 [Corynebacterium phage PSonyx]
MLENVDLTQVPQEELNAAATAINLEVNRRIERDRIPLEIEETAQRGREMGLTDEVMVEAVTKRPEVIEPATLIDSGEAP